MMKFEVKTIPLSKLQLDTENPRFITPPNATEQDIINYLLEYEEIESLAESINENRGLYPGERIIAVAENDHYIVLEGNRRISACKILCNQQLLKNYRPASSILAYADTLTNISEIETDILPSRVAAQSALAAKHIDGIKKWSPISKAKFFAKEFSRGKSLAEIQRTTGSSASTIKKGIREYNLIHYALNLPEWTEKEIGLIPDINKLKISPFTRIFVAGSNLPNVPTLGTILDLQYDDSLQPTSSIPKEIFDHCIYLVAKSSFDKSISFDTRSTMQDVVGLIAYMKQQEVFSGYFAADATADSKANDDVSQAPGKSRASDLPQDEVAVTSTEAPASNDSTGDPKSTVSKSSSTQTEDTTSSSSAASSEQRPQSTGGRSNLPYFFDGLQFGHLDSHDPLTHGISRICNELKNFSDRKLVKSCPVAAAFLIRAIIEHSLIYYAKKQTIQASADKIWSRIADNKGQAPKLSIIIDKYKKGLPNYIADTTIRQYFTDLFGDSNSTTEPLNWIVHRPEEYVLSPSELAELPGRGLLALINYLIS